MEGKKKKDDAIPALPPAVAAAIEAAKAGWR
jgi:hypothetical protein